MDKDYIFDYNNRVYRIFTSTLILNGFDAFLLQVKSLQDYDDYLAAHCISDNTWYIFDALGNKTNSLEVFVGFPQDFLNKKLEYVKANDFPPIEEQSYIHKMRSIKMKGLSRKEYYSKTEPEVSNYFDETQYPVKLNDTPSNGIKNIFKKLK